MAAVRGSHIQSDSDREVTHVTSQSRLRHRVVNLCTVYIYWKSIYTVNEIFVFDGAVKVGDMAFDAFAGSAECLPDVGERQQHHGAQFYW